MTAKSRSKESRSTNHGPVRGAGIPTTGRTVVSTRTRQLQPQILHAFQTLAMRYLLYLFSLSPAFAKQLVAKDLSSRSLLRCPFKQSLRGCSCGCDSKLRLQFLIHHATLRVAATKLLQTEDFRQKFTTVPPKDATI